MKVVRECLYDEIYNLFCSSKLTFVEIAKLEFLPSLSIKRVRNIIYKPASLRKSEFELKIYRLFRLAFLELQDIPAAIQYCYENQPKIRLKENSIRKIVNYMRSKK